MGRGTAGQQAGVTWPPHFRLAEQDRLCIDWTSAGAPTPGRAVSTASPPAAPSGVYPLAGLRRSPRLASPPGPRLLPSVHSYASSRAAAFGAIHLPAHQFRPCLVARFPSFQGVAARCGAVATRPRRKLLAASASGSCAAVLLLPRRL